MFKFSNLAIAAVTFSLIIINSINADAQESDAMKSETTMTVTVEWLGEHINHKNLVLLHIGQKDEFDNGHIPGAQYISNAEIAVPKADGELSLQLLPTVKLKENFEKLGISNDSRIILYFGKDWVTSTTRVYFTLDYAGLMKNTSILDGGMPAWVAAGKSLSKKVISPQRGSLTVVSNDEYVAKAEWLKAKLNDRTVKIVDARTPNFYDGSSVGRYPRAGHIKGARNIPFTKIVDENNNFKNDAVLRKLFADAGVGKYDTVVTYCHIGQQASLAYFAAKKLGYKVKLYDGSFEEWSADDSLEVEDPMADQRQIEKQ